MCSVAFSAKMINNGRVFFFFQLWSINYPGNAQQCGGILQIHHHHPSSHCDLPNPRAKHLSGGNSRFTFPSFAFRLNRRVRLPKSPLPGSVEFTAKGTNILQHCFVSSLQPAAQIDQLKGNKRQPLVGQMVLRRGLGADWWRRAEHRHGDAAQKQVYGRARQLREAQVLPPEIPRRLLT